MADTADALRLLTNTLDAQKRQRSALVATVKERDAEIMSSLAHLCDEMMSTIAKDLREHAKFTFSPIEIDLKELVTSATLAIEQVEQTYIAFAPIIFRVVLDGESVIVNDQRFDDSARAQRFMAETTARSLAVTKTRADFGFFNDPTRLAAERQRGG